MTRPGHFHLARARHTGTGRDRPSQPKGLPWRGAASGGWSGGERGSVVQCGDDGLPPGEAHHPGATRGASAAAVPGPAGTGAADLGVVVCHVHAASSGAVHGLRWPSVPSSPSTLGRSPRGTRQEHAITSRTADVGGRSCGPACRRDRGGATAPDAGGPVHYPPGRVLATTIWRSRRISPRTSHVGGFFPCRTGQSDDYGGIPEGGGRGRVRHPGKAVLTPLEAAYSG
jgi:hypothetical protein